MAADFDAGSIEGTLDLNTKPFTAGLRRAREQARRFERERFEAQMGLDTGAFEAKRARLAAQMEGMKRKVVTPEVEVKGIAKTLVGLALLKKALNSVNRGFVMTGSAAGKIAATGVSILTNKIVLLTAAAVVLGAALGPLAGATLAFAGAAASAVGPLAIAFGLFGGAVAGAIGELKKANAEGERLAGWGGEAQDRLKTIKKRWEEMSKAVRPQIFESMTWLLGGALSAMLKLQPVLTTVADGFVGLSKEIHNVLNSKRFTQFAGVLDKFMKGFMRGLTPVVRDLMYAFMTSFRELQPILSIFGQGIQRGAAWLRKFTSEGQGLEKFVARIVPLLPKVGDLIGSIFSTIGKIASGLAPLAGPALDFVTALVDGLGNLNWAGLASAMVPIVQTLTKALPHIVDGLNWVIRLVDSLANADGLGQLAVQAGLLLGVMYKLSKISMVSGALGLLGGGKGGKHAAKGAGLGGLVSQVRFLAGAGGIVAMAKGWKNTNAENAKANRLMGIFQSTAGAAAAGFAIGGPWGAVAGTVGGAATSIWRAWRATSASAQAARRNAAEVRALKDATKDYLGTLNSANAATTKQTNEMAYARLKTAGLLDVATKLGMTERQMVQAITGNRQARDLLARRLAGNTTLTNAQKDALVREGVAVEKSKVKSAQMRVERAKAALATENDTRKIAGHKRELHNARQALEKLRAQAKNGIKVKLETAEAKAQARELKSFFNSLFGKTIVQGVTAGSKGSPSDPNNPINNQLPKDARGGVTRGPRLGWTGDNPGGQEAIVPLNEYDLPKKGDIAAIAATASASNRAVVQALREIAEVFRGKDDTGALADALDKVLGKHSDAQVRKMVQMQRAGGAA